MKRELFFLIVVLLTINLVLSQEMPASDSQTDLKKIDAENTSIKNIFGDAQKATNDAISKEIPLSENTKKLAIAIFRLKQGDILNIQLLIVLICVSAFFLLIIRNFVQFIPSFTKSSSWIGALIIAFLISAMGVFRQITFFLLGLGNIFTILEKWGPLKLGLLVMGIFLFYLVSSIIIGIIKETIILGKSVRDGIKIGAQLAKQKAISESEAALS